MMKKSLLLSATAFSVLFGVVSMQDANAAFQVNVNWKPAMYESIGVEASNFADKTNIKEGAFNKVYAGMNAEGLYLFGDKNAGSRFGAGIVLGYQKVEYNDEDSDTSSASKGLKLTPLVLYSQGSTADPVTLVSGERTDLTDEGDFTKVTVDEITDPKLMIANDASIEAGTTGIVSLGDSFVEKSSMQIGVKLAYEYDMGDLVFGAGLTGSFLPTTLKWKNVIDTVTDGTDTTVHSVSEENENESEFNGWGYGLDATVAYQMGMFALKLGIAWDQAFETELSGSDTPVPTIDNGETTAGVGAKTANNGVGNTSSDKFKVSEGTLSLLAGVSISF